jgi:1,2-diacylglycerol 3-alpha-glucosyltransferase
MLGWTIAKRKNVPFILSHHTFWNKYTHYFPAGKLIRPKIVEKFTQVFANSCDAVISPSQMSKKELMSYGITTPISVIHHGLDLTKYSESDTNFLRKKYKIPSTHKILLYIGRLNKEKSVEMLIDSFSKIYKTNSNTVLVLLGDGPEKDHLVEMTKDLNIQKAVYFMNSIDYKNIPAVLHSSDLFVFASKTETFGKVVIEAMAAGVPTVTFKIAPFTEIIQNNKDGLLVSPNAISLAKGVVSVLENDELRNEMGKNALLKSQEFSIEHSIKKIEKIYIKTCDEHESRSKRGITKIFNKVKNLIEVELN